jgi:transposase
MDAANARVSVAFQITGGEKHAGRVGQEHLPRFHLLDKRSQLIMNKTYERNAMRQLALDLGYRPVVPPKSNGLSSWRYNKKIYKRRNETERLFRRLKAFRRIFSRFEKLDFMFIAFLQCILIFDDLR